MSEVNLSVLQIEGLEETDPGLRFEFVVGEKSCGETYFYGSEEAISLPSEGKYRISMYGSEGFIADMHGDMRTISGRNRIWLNLTPTIKLLLSAPTLPAIAETSETPRSEEMRESFSQLSTKNLHLRILELQSELDHERATYLLNIEQFVAHHKAVQDKYRLMIENLERKNAKLTSVIDDLQSQAKMQKEKTEKAEENEAVWKGKVDELTGKLQEAHTRFIDRERQFRVMLSEIGNRSKLLEDENHGLREEIVTYESRIFEINEMQKKWELKALQEQRSTLCGRCLEVKDPVEEVPTAKSSASSQNSFSKEPKSADRITHSSSKKVPKTSKSLFITPQKTHKSTKSSEMVTLTSTHGVITVHSEGQELPLAEFLKIRSASIEGNKGKRTGEGAKKVERVETPGKKRCQFTVILDEDDARSKSCGFPKPKGRNSPVYSVKAQIESKVRSET